MLHEISCRFAEEQFALKGGIPGTWVIACGFNVAFIEIPFANDNEKFAASESMRAMVRAIQPQAYSFITEAWVALIDRDKLGEAAFKRWSEFSGEYGVKNLPDSMRDDVLMVFTHDPEKTTAARYLVNMRPRGPNYLGVRIEEFPDDAMNWSGRMGNFYGPAKAATVPT